MLPNDVKVDEGEEQSAYVEYGDTVYCLSCRSKPNHANIQTFVSLWNVI